MSEEEKATMGEMTGHNRRIDTSREEVPTRGRKYALHQTVCIGQLSDEEESDTKSDYSGYSHFG